MRGRRQESKRGVAPVRWQLLDRNSFAPGNTLTANLVIDGRAPIAMTVNGDNVSLNTPELSVGKHSFTMTYFLDGKRVAVATTSAMIVAGQNTPITFEISRWIKTLIGTASPALMK